MVLTDNVFVLCEGLSVEDVVKRCAACREWKPLTEFHKLSRARDGLFYRCKPCARIQQSKYRETLLAGSKRWYQKNREAYLAKRAAERTPEKTRRKWLKERYGLTNDDYLAMIEAQGGRCAICHDEQGEKLHIDHDHATGKIRQLLCHRCNMAIGLFKECPGAMFAAIEYLVRHGSASDPYEHYDEPERWAA